MKQLIVFFWLSFLVFSPVKGQDTTRHWFVQTGYGIEKHDKRLFDYSEKEELLAKQPEAWGTYHFNIALYRKLKQIKKNSFYAGLGIGYENATFRRPFDHEYFKDDHTRILLLEDKYEKIYLPISLMILHKRSRAGSLYLQIDSHILFFRKIDNTRNNSGYFPMSKWTSEFEKLNLKAGFNFAYKNFTFGSNMRLVNFQKIDKIILNRTIKDPRINEKWELYNPLQFNLLIGYTW